MKTKDKIILIFFSIILMFLITGIKVEATATLNDFNNLIVAEEETRNFINENLSIPSELENQKYLITYFHNGTNYSIKLYYFNPENWSSYYRLKLYETTVGTGRGFKIRPYNQNNSSGWDTSNDRYCEYFFGLYQYTTTDFLTYNLVSHIVPGTSKVESPSFTTASGTGMQKFITGNIDIYAEDYETMVFQPPVEQLTEMVGLVPLEIMRPTQVQEKIAETLKTIVPIALMVFSALLSPFLIRFLISLKK